MLKRTKISCRAKEGGAVVVETTIALLIYVGVILFMIDAGIVLYRYTYLTSTTSSLTRYLATEIGKAWGNGSVNCTTYLNTTGDAYLATKPGPGSLKMSNAAATFSFAPSIVTTDPNAPYAILRVVGTMRPSCIVCKFFRNAAVTSESSALIEYQYPACS